MIEFLAYFQNHPLPGRQALSVILVTTDHTCLRSFARVNWQHWVAGYNRIVNQAILFDTLLLELNTDSDCLYLFGIVGDN